jgi:hypothetical protein
LELILCNYAATKAKYKKKMLEQKILCRFYHRYDQIMLYLIFYTIVPLSCVHNYVNFENKRHTNFFSAF